MTARPVNAALLGSGLFATGAYLPSLKEVAGLNVSTVWSRSEESARKLEGKAAELGLKAPAVKFGDDGLRSVLGDKSIEAVILVLPITVQPDMIRRAWRAGKHVLSEKPLGRDVAEGKALIREYENEWKPNGLIWHWAHEPFLLKAGNLLRTGAIGDVLYWRMHFEATIRDGVSFHGTTWRTVPEYQGGFILDGGVHWAAMLRIVLPETCRPVFVTAYKSLHRSHILPHDTVVGIVHPAHSATHEPCGSPTSVKAEITADEMPVKPGKSTPHGTFILSWAAPDTPAGSRPPNELYIVAEHGTVRIVNTGGKWNAKLYPTDSTGLQEATLDGPATGVEEELADYARAVAAVRVGKTDDKANNAEPRAALWDLAFVEAALTSDGKKMTIAYE